MFASVQYRVLKLISPGAPGICSGAAYLGKSKLEVLLGSEFLQSVEGKVVIDFGCGEGNEAIEIARSGAKRVIGLDIREDVLRRAAGKALAVGVGELCVFASSTSELADVIVSVDAFEHFADPVGVLHAMYALLRPGGEAFISFGPTWFHPYGGHLFSVFPWAHLIFSEEAMIRWRSSFISDGARRFSEVSGGLNQMTIKRFERFVRASDFGVAVLEPVPIAKLRPFHNRLTREFTTAVVRCRLIKRA